jgi:hypothetical protein
MIQILKKIRKKTVIITLGGFKIPVVAQAALG